jgi:hypothetical protein
MAFPVLKLIIDLKVLAVTVATFAVLSGALFDVRVSGSTERFID